MAEGDKKNDKTVKLDQQQFEQHQFRQNAIVGAVNRDTDLVRTKLDESTLAVLSELKKLQLNVTFDVAPIVKALIGESIDDKNCLSGNIAKHISLQTDVIEEGFRLLVEAVTNNQPPPPPPAKQLEVRFVFKVADDHPDEPFSIAIGGVTDAENNPIPDASGLTVAVETSDPAVVDVTFDDASKSGSIHFGAPGVAAVTASVTNAKGDILGSGAADFTVTTGDPAAVSDVTLSFPGLTEEPPA